MARGPISFNTAATVDVQGPGAVIFVGLFQDSNSAGRLRYILPMADSDGTPLTGLAHLKVYVGVNIAEGQGYDEVIANAEASYNVDLTPADAGTEKDVPITIPRPGDVLSVAAWPDDS